MESKEMGKDGVDGSELWLRERPKSENEGDRLAGAKMLMLVAGDEPTRFRGVERVERVDPSVALLRACAGVEVLETLERPPVRPTEP